MMTPSCAYYQRHLLDAQSNGNLTFHTENHKELISFICTLNTILEATIPSSMALTSPSTLNILELFFAKYLKWKIKFSYFTSAFPMMLWILCRFCQLYFLPSC